jgi:hypothetical protein
MASPERAARAEDPAPGAAPEDASRRAAPFEPWLVALLCLATLACWAPQFRFFFLPNNDYGTFEAVARSLRRLEVPTSFQRLPLLPAAMALLAPLLPGRHALLDAALLLNAAFAVATLPLLYLFAARSLGRGALLVPVLFAGTALFHGTGLQPLVEPSLCFFVVLAFVLFQRRSSWQYAAAAAAALSRYEAAALLGIFAFAGVLEDRRWLRHGTLAALAGAPFLLWLVLGALRGSGAAFYAADMDRMGFSPAPHVLATLLKETYRGWWSGAPGPELPLFLCAAALPTVLGLSLGLRRFRRETLAAVAYLTASLLVIVGLGIDKARYVEPLLWIPLWLFAAGLGLLASARVRERAEALPTPLVALWPLAAGAAALGLGRHWLAKLLHAPEGTPLSLDLLYLGVLTALAAAALAPPLRGLSARGRLAAAGAAASAFVLAFPIFAGGMEAKQGEQYKARFANYGVVLTSEWLARHAPADARIVAMNRQHFGYLGEIQPARIVPFYDLEARDAASLAAEMRVRGLAYLVATWRKPVAQAIDHVYERKFKWFLVDPFAEGEPVPGFEHVASLPLPAHLGSPPVQIYRLAHE